ncbi:MAG: hypothetical protein RR123_04870 [Clostridia bacterium]
MKNRIKFKKDAYKFTENDNQKYSYLDFLDLRPIINSVTIAENIGEIKYCDTVILPRDREPEVMEAIAKIKIKYCEEVLFLKDDEEIKLKNIKKFSGIEGVTLTEKDLLLYEEISISGVAAVLIEKLNKNIEYAKIKISGIAALYCDFSVKEANLKIETKGIHWMKYVEDASKYKMIVSNVGGCTIDSETLKSLTNVIYVINAGKVKIEEDVTNEMLIKSNIEFMVNSGNIVCHKKVRGYMYEHSISNAGKVIVRLW